MTSISQLLLEFEKRVHESELSVKEFANECSNELDKETLLALIVVSTEHLLRKGSFTDSSQYELEFPSLSKQEIQESIASSIDNFVESYCPITDLIGKFPVEHDGYRFIRELGRGGTGVVYEAQQLALGRPVAIKVLFAGTAGLSAEATILSRLEHPNISSVYDHGKVDYLHYIVMQIIHGHTLKSHCRNPPNLSTLRAVSLMIEVLDAIAECHSRGIVHWDLKPANILISEGKPVVVDFGLAQNLDTKRKLLVGSPHYLAPEALDGDNSVSPTLCDIYSLGAILYELLTGNRPFIGGRDSYRQPPRHPQDYRQEIDDELDRICLKAISVSPAVRFQTARSFRESLVTWLNQKLPQQVANPLELSISDEGFQNSGTSGINRKQPGLLLALVALTLLASLANLLLPFRGADTMQHQAANGGQQADGPGTSPPTRTMPSVSFSDSNAIVQFPAPAYCYLVAANPDGSLQFLASTDKKVEQFTVPFDAGSSARREEGKGKQAFLVLMTQDPIQQWEDWQTNAPKNTGWENSTGQVGAWELNGNTMTFIAPATTEISDSVANPVSPPLLKLAKWFELECNCSVYQIQLPTHH